MSDEILMKVKVIAAALFDVPVSKITAETGPATIETWDSVQHLNLMLELEQSFGVKLEPEDMEEMRTIGGTAKLIERKQRG